MIRKEHLMDIRSLKKQGYSQRLIAGMIGIHRKTVKKYLQEESMPVYKRINRQGKLEEFKELINGWLEQRNYQATKIHELLLIQGFNGSYPTVQRYVQKEKEKKNKIAYVRFETIPGEQAQVDFADFQITESDGTIKTVYCFIMVLGYSRNMYIEFIEKCTMVNFLECHQNAFGYFSGIPAEILYDNMKNVVIKRHLGSIQWNKTFEEFSFHYGFKPIVAPAYSPWVKGKVERPIKYVRERFWNGYQYNNLKQANKDIHQWIREVANKRIHGTTQEIIEIRFEKEQSKLGALPLSPYDISEKVYRKVSKDCQISFKANRYVVPYQSVGRKVLLKIRKGIIKIFDDDQMLVVYKIPEGKGHTVENPRFYKELRKDKEQLRRKYQKPFGKAKATRSIIKNGLNYEVEHRSLSDYDQEVTACPN